MGTCLKLGSVVAAILLICSCASKESDTSTAFARPARALETVDSLAENPKAGNAVVQHAQAAIGTPYVRGGSKPGGFDCSGLVQWAYQRIGVKVPRTAREQSTIGKKVKNIKDMRAGDIVAFNHPKRGYHTGIYVGDGKFIHSPRKRSRVKISSLDDPYFSKTLLSARRVDTNGASGTLIASAESQLENYLTQKSRNELKTNKSKAIKRTTSKAVKSKKIARASQKAVASKKSSQKTAAKASGKKSSKAVAQKKNNIKTVAQNTSKNIRQAAKVTSKKTAQKNSQKSSHKSVSLLHKKQAQKSSRS